RGKDGVTVRTTRSRYSRFLQRRCEIGERINDQRGDQIVEPGVVIIDSGRRDLQRARNAPQRDARRATRSHLRARDQLDLPGQVGAALFASWPWHTPPPLDPS